MWKVSESSKCPVLSVLTRGHTGLFLVGPEAGSVQDREGRLGVHDFALSDHFEAIRQRDRFHLDELVVLSCRSTASESGRDEQVNPLVRESRRRENGRHPVDMARGAPRLLPELANRARGWILSRFQTPGGDLEDVAIRGISVLPKEQKRRVIARRVTQKRHHRTRTRMADYFELPKSAVGELNRVDVE